jgi:dUTP pyrophosphatase
MFIESGYFGRIFERSGLAVKNCLRVGAGVIDSDYRGDVRVVLFNHSPSPITVSVGMRVAQIVFLRCDPVVLEDMTAASVDELKEYETARGVGGFGSTGGGVSA